MGGCQCLAELAGHWVTHLGTAPSLVLGVCTVLLVVMWLVFRSRVVADCVCDGGPVLLVMGPHW